jgi:hypothetical protein
MGKWLSSVGWRRSNQSHPTVLLCLQTLGQFAHRGPVASRIALDVEQQPIRQWRHLVAARHFLAGALAPADLVTEIGKNFEIAFDQGIPTQCRALPLLLSWFSQPHLQLHHLMIHLSNDGNNIGLKKPS